MFLFALNYLFIVLKLSTALLNTWIRFNQFPVHYAAGDKRYEFLEAENKRVQRELVVVAAKRCVIRPSYHLHLLTESVLSHSYKKFINLVLVLQIQRQRCSTEEQEQSRNRYSIAPLLNVNPQHYQILRMLLMKCRLRLRIIGYRLQIGGYNLRVNFLPGYRVTRMLSDALTMLLEAEATGTVYHGSLFPSQMKEMSEAVVQGQLLTGCDLVIAVQRVWWVYPTSATGNESLTARSSLISWKDISMEGFVSRGATCFFCQCETLRSKRLSASRGQTMESSSLHSNKSIIFYPGAQDETKTTKVVTT
ncbi:hypothetical protein Tco_0713085 [Tanacetum coccineum]